MVSKPFCECEAQFCPHQAAGCSNPPVGKADIMTFHMNLCNDCFQRHSEYSPGDVSWLKLGIHASQKEAMITSDTQLETLQEVPAGEAQKDDLAVNSHPADGAEGGAPVLDGELHHTERPNVNAMREAIETQDEMEVGKPVDVKQEEIEAEGTEKEVTVEKGSGTQIIINIAGKKKELGFTNLATAQAFIKEASVRFGKKFAVLSRPDQCPECGSLEYTAYKDGKRYNPFERGQGLWDTNKCDECGHVYPFRIVHVMEDKPATSGMSDIDGGAPSFKGAAAKTAKNCTVCGKPVELSPSAVERAKRHGGNPSDYTNLFDTHAKCQIEKRNNETSDLMRRKREEAEANKVVLKGASIFDESRTDKSTHWPEIYKGTWIDTPVQHGAPNQGRGFNNYPGIYVLLPGSNTAYGNPEGGFQSEQQAETYNQQFCGGKGKVTVHGKAASESINKEGSMKKYKVYTGPTLVKPVAEKLRKAGIPVNIEGTEHVHFSTDKPREEVLRALRAPYQAEDGEAVGWSDRDISEMPSHTAGGMNFSPSNVPSQVVQQFYPELQHEIISYPNVTNAPMVNPEITGDAHELGTAPAEGIGEATLTIHEETTPEAELLPGAIEDAFEGMNRIGYISTSPAGGAGIGRDGKPQVLEGLPLRKENDIRGPMFMEEFNAQYDAIPGAALAISASAIINKKVAAAEEKQQFSLFLKRVMGEVAASFIAAFKVTSKMPMNKVPGIGEIQLAQVEQSQNTSAFNIVNTGSRVKYLMDKLTDSEIQDAINDAYAQGAIWHEGKEGGFVYEVFVRAETIDTESMILKYKFVTGTKEAE
jgi:hypothetical protein